ncbi:hypothetical protein L1D61_19445 [Vibrio mediterranei]|nr:hypothetical protein [Vibrio mediterranei]
MNTKCFPERVSNNVTSMNSQCWEPIDIEPNRYFNPSVVPGYEIKHGPKGNPLHGCVEPAFEQGLAQRYQQLKHEKPSLKVKRAHFAMPQLDAAQLPSASDYELISEPRSLCSTSVSIVLAPQADIDKARIGYHFKGNKLEDLRDRLESENNLDGLIGNLGYFMTKELNIGDHIWSHRRRFPNPDHQLPEVLSYLGFYYFSDENGKVETAGFPSAHDAAVAIDRAGNVQIVPSLTFRQFNVTIGGTNFDVDCFNPSLESLSQHDVALFNVKFPMKHQGDLVEFSPMLELEGRVNLFLANQGDGTKPFEEVVAIWNGTCPLPSFGTLISIEEKYFESLFSETPQVGQAVKVIPVANEIDLCDYKQILGGLVPSVINGQSLVPTGPTVSAMQAEAALDAVANTDSPLSRSGKETNNFDALIREPSGLFIETENHIGYLLFDGRHEMSIGANIVDVANLVQRLSQPDLDFFEGESVINAIAIDGGSAMKVYAAKTSTTEAPTMDLLNRVAAGGRNAPGNDPQGLNLYSTVILELNNA